MGQQRHAALGPLDHFRIERSHFLHRRRAHVERLEFVHDAVMRPAGHRHHLAQCHATRQLRQRRHAPACIPAKEFFLRGLIVAAKTAELNTWRRRTAIGTHGDLRAADARFFSKQAHAHLFAQRQHGAVLGAQVRLYAGRIVLEEKIQRFGKYMRAFGTEHQHKIVAARHRGVAGRPHAGGDLVFAHLVMRGPQHTLTPRQLLHEAAMQPLQIGGARHCGQVVPEDQQ
ncbi:MAG: hypothetical protein EBT83_08105 [Betaproteobacteria bacterium]|nr:hypothetical protein [Betaproteobacteria bacterium]